jgi:hypothetical protein
VPELRDEAHFITKAEALMTSIDPKALEAISQLILQGGAIVVLIWVVTLLTSGKLHTSSEIDGLRKDKEDLLAMNKRISDALEQTNDLLDKHIGRRQ